MPRKPRLQSSTDYYHVMMRGNNKEKIFISSAQKNFFLGCLNQLNDDGLINIVAYCIMDNHVHLVVKADIVDLSNYKELGEKPTPSGVGWIAFFNFLMNK